MTTNETVQLEVLSNIAKSDIQGFITSGFGHIYHTRYFFLKITDKALAQTWLKNIEAQVTSARSWRPTEEPDVGEGAQQEPEKVPPKRVTSLAFSFDGLRELGLPSNVLKTFPVQFQEGMNAKHRALAMGDTNESAPSTWGIGNPEYPFHILLILNTGENPDDKSDIDSFADEHLAAFADNGLAVVFEEKGYRREDDKELFGFKDGIGQPKIEKVNVFQTVNGEKVPITNATKTGEFILGYPDAYNFMPPTPVISKALDPDNLLPVYDNPFNVDDELPSADYKDLGLHGSYVVYRKLKQDIVAFWKFIVAEIERIDGKVSPERVVWLASKFVGRKPNGDPLMPVHNHSKQDGFLYSANDKEGLHCPVGSHIRRTNPRDVLHPEGKESSLEITSKHRIMRRGRVFGDSLFDLSELDDFYLEEQLEVLLNLQDTSEEPSGLHFLCVNANIQRQFEFIQDSWSNNPDFNELYQNKDPIIGDNSYTEQPPSHMSIPASPVRIRTSALPRFVTVMGGAYLFMPSKTALRFLAQI